MIVRSSLPLVVMISFGLLACGGGPGTPSRGGGGGGRDAGTSDGSTGGGRDAGDCTPSPEGSLETCSDGVDNNCDFRTDCADPLCSGVGSCPICGEVETPLGSPLALPDGVGGTTCSTDADCPGAQRCFSLDPPTDSEKECRESYRSTLSFIGFGGAVFDSPTDIRSLCVVMEHSWLRDLEVTLEAPNGAKVQLQRFLGQEGDEIYLGEADDCDTASSPSPGVGARYCWTPSATRPAMLDYANAGGALDGATECLFGLPVDVMPPGDYSAADPWTNFLGSPLNGDWTLSVTDLWEDDARRPSLSGSSARVTTEKFACRFALVG